ncbi:PREDICTED: probable S-adenosylmethionine-dependent methyltransferase At5g38100 [Nicotiana attenuata]|uniref:S-adenosylmethionine-dependent methyltransferase n=1 Tax=Nicotiana attenuata TaxID=49451 RepID=A0A1J6KFQ1_NICAT|nr:PREDICTED: probable S-adenosylmethionine-dependent methyltransferase At5g38100 [Nicotiana attenuata]OIT20727.1 putative s-adenosylmethionine-dependent methyltransferase [Nicotiana attenuata]
MAVERNINSSHEFPMASGASPFSYKKNSAYQRRVVRATKQLVNAVVAEKLQVESLNIQRGIFQITDMGCSTGPNTFISVQNIVESVELKFQNKNDTKIPKIQVFFSDHSFNDFNTLFASLPTNKPYYAAAAVGSFYDRVFPDESLHIVNCSYGLHFLSKVPSEVEDKTSPAWNKGKIYYSHAKEEVIREYERQYEKDMDSFLNARAQEVVPGGLVFITVPARPDGTPHSKVIYNMLADTLGSCFVDLAKQGENEIEEDEVDAFNIPVYSTSPSEIEEAITRNGCFDIEKLEILPKETSPINGLTAKDASVHIRAITEGLIEEKFGPKILDKLFHLYTQKLEDAYLDLLSGEAISLFVALKRKTNI